MIFVSDIQRATAAHFKVPPETMAERNNRGEGKNQRNRREISRPRQVAMYLTKEMTGHSLSNIGRLFGGRDHSTVIYAIKTVGELDEKDPQMSATIDHLLTELGALRG